MPKYLGEDSLAYLVGIIKHSIDRVDRRIGSYRKIRKVKNYLYEVWYDNIDYDYAYEHYKQSADIPVGACSSVRNGDFYGRNFDWFYNEQAEFVVHTDANGGRYASIGVAGSVTALTNEFVESGVYNEAYKLVPFQMLDGINEYGVVANTNVVPIDDGTNYVVPTENSEVELSGLMLIRYILDNFKTATDAVEYIQKHMTIYFSTQLHDMHYEMHFMIADKDKTYLLEFVGNRAVVIDMTDDAESTLAGKPYMTNFVLSGVNLNDDGSVYTPETQDTEHNAHDTNLVSDTGSGLERYNYIVENYGSADTADGMRELMDGLKYTKAYITSESPSDPYWYTEFVGVNGLTVASPVADFAHTVEVAGGYYTDRSRGTALTWQTTHSAVYDIANGTMNLIVQEDGEEIGFELGSTGGGFGTFEHPRLVGRDEPDQHPITAISGLVEALAEAANVIEGVRSNGAMLPVTNKIVDLPQFEGANGLALRDGKLYLTNNGVLVGEGIVLPQGGGGSDNNAVLTVTNTSGWLAKTIASGSSCTITLNWSSLEDNISTGDGILNVSVNGIARIVRNIPQGALSLDVTQYLTASENTVVVTVKDIYGNSKTINYTVSVVTVSIRSSFNGNAVYTGAIDFFYTPIGAAEKTVYFYLDNELLDTATVMVSDRQQNFTIPAQPHGSHSFEVYFTATIDGNEVESNHLYYDFICVADGDNTPIISSTFTQTSVAQYDTVVIPYLVYSPNTLTSNITLKADGVTVANLTVDRTMQTWVYRLDNYGDVELQIVCGDTTKTISLTVEQTIIDVEAETNNLELYLDSYGRSNNESAEQRATWTYQGISAEFSDFNWISDGWILDENNNTVLRIGGDARLYIPLNVFGQNFTNTGKTIEIEFSTRDVLDYETTIISCQSAGRGVVYTPQRATLTSEQSSLYTQYKENEHIRLSFVVEKRAEYRLVYIYVNGIMSGVTQYPNGDDFSQGVPVGISIGSSECTVDLYNIRVYNNSLTRHQILDNWIADTQSIYEKLDRYNRNKIFNAYGEIVINQLPPDLPYFVFNAEGLPTYKGDKRTVDGYYVDPTNNENNFSFTGAQADVQGTSSQYYARKNFKVKFKNGFVRDDMTYSTYQMRGDDSIGTNTFTFKADVASSEGANNVELVRLYNEISPYKTPPQKSDARIRQGIDGFPMVVFQDSGNGATFIGRYNFNNDKGTPEVFGFQNGDESWEVLNNDSARVMFKSGEFTGWENDFEARYPEENTSIVNLQRFVAWVASTDQSAATNAVLESAVEYDGVQYTHDTAAYRLAKFKDGIADWVEMDSALFYYLFTEFFLMIDSRAKNMFPSFLGGDKWCFLPYDFDTAIGINNVGALSFSYDLEDIDTQAGSNIFNGQPSVLWINLREAFYGDLAAMYRNLRSNTGLNYNNVIQMFAEHQSKWCEAIWNEDAYFKYLQPLINDGDASYLDMLLGSKSEQRKWWLYNRFKYLDSKYVAGDASAQSIVVRIYNPSDITITPYASIYAVVKYGSQLVMERALNGTPTTIECPFEDMGANGTETMIYSADQILDVGDLSPLKIGYANFSAATRLSALKIGDASPDYYNGNLTRLELGNNTLLRSIDVRNCPNLINAVSLEGCTNIENIYFDGTSVPSVTLPVGGIAKILHLPETVTNLTVIGHQSITDFSMPSGENLSTLRLENTSYVIDSLALLADMAANGRVRLLGINWEIDTAEEALEVAEKITQMRGVEVNDEPAPTAVVTGRAYITDTVSLSDLSDTNDILQDVVLTVDGVDDAFLCDGGAIIGSDGAFIMRDTNNECSHSADVVNEFLMQSLHFMEVMASGA